MSGAGQGKRERTVGQDAQCQRESIKESLRRLQDAGLDAGALNVFCTEHDLKISNSPLPPDHDLAVHYLQVAWRHLKVPIRAAPWGGYAIPCACAVGGCRCSGVTEVFYFGKPLGFCDRHAERYRFEMGLESLRAVDLYERALPKGWRSAVYLARQYVVATPYTMAGNRIAGGRLDGIAGEWLAELLKQAVAAGELNPAEDGDLCPTYDAVRKVRNRLCQEVTFTAIGEDHRTAESRRERTDELAAEQPRDRRQNPLEALGPHCP